MSTPSSGLVPRLLIGIAVGAVAVAVYNRRSALQALVGTRAGGLLPPAGRALTTTGEKAMQNITQGGGARDLPAILQANVNTIVARAQRYIQSARTQLDIAIAEGQITAEQTRKELEARFAAAKADPDSARSAFK